jgi:primosomal protein N'
MGKIGERWKTIDALFVNAGIMKIAPLEKVTEVISRKLAEEIRERLEKKEQVMVLLNRRGYSPVVMCRACGKTLQCKDCAVSMTHHKRERKMECHYCGYVARIPDKCAHCGSEYVYFVGTGSEKLLHESDSGKDRLPRGFWERQAGSAWRRYAVDDSRPHPRCAPVRQRRQVLPRHWPRCPDRSLPGHRLDLHGR